MSLMTILLWILFGAIVGWIASAIMHVSEGFWGNVLIGIVGAVLGGLLFNLIGISTTGVMMSLLSAVLGAVILLAIVRAVRRPGPAMSP
jgi:uncharacterized membrane protein YeaQ/YmgE (transglycosylase-associated protein family)